MCQSARIATSPPPGVCLNAFSSLSHFNGSQQNSDAQDHVVHMGSAPRWCEDFKLFLNVFQTRCGHILVYREVAHSTGGRLGMPAGVTAVEQSQATGRVEQRVRPLREDSTSMLKK